MQITIKSPAELGQALRVARRQSNVRLDDLAAIAGVSKQFTTDVERGKPTVQLGRVLKLLSEIGIRFVLDVPEEAGAALIDLRAKTTASAALQYDVTLSAGRSRSSKRRRSKSRA